jgi:hypothetical protein
MAERERNIVKQGGVAKDEADAEDVSRDSYGYTGSSNTGEQADPDEARRRAEEVLPADGETSPGDTSGDFGPKG